MALPSSGAISWSMIQTEFGGSNPINISEYYRGGALVPNTAANAAVPTAGAIKASDFYGASAFSLVIQILDGSSYDDSGGGTAGVTYGTSGLCSYSTSSGSASANYNWCNTTDTTVTDNYEIMQTNTGNGVLAGPSAGTWNAMSSARTWSVSGGVTSVLKQRTLTVSIRLIGSGTTIDTGTVTLSAESEASCVVVDSWMGLIKAADVKPHMVFSTYRPGDGFVDWPVEKTLEPRMSPSVRLTTETGAILRCSTHTPSIFARQSSTCIPVIGFTPSICLVMKLLSKRTENVVGRRLLA